MQLAVAVANVVVALAILALDLRSVSPSLPPLPAFRRYRRAARAEAEAAERPVAGRALWGPGSVGVRTEASADTIRVLGTASLRRFATELRIGFRLRAGLPLGSQGENACDAEGAPR
jgi:hypothetical protein